MAACRVVLCCEECPVKDMRPVFSCVILITQNTGRTSITGHSSQHNTTRHATTIMNWNSEINMTFNNVTLAGQYSSLMMVLGPKHVGAFLMF